ncbi:MAG TPA: threonylcarbamoyl-AMP synthase [Bacteroides sp.]|nr:threonylcarbamoyl-AMP synthase [Bacteroides sp.]
MREEIKRCLEVLRKGGSILYPTDTIWGIGCDATNPEAVAKVYNIKKRVDSKAMLVLVDSVDMIYNYVNEVPEMALEILNLQHESPMTIIYPTAIGLAENLVADDGSIGIRVTSEPFSKELIRAFRKPIVSSSANIASQAAPAKFSEISDEIRSAADYIAGWKQDDGKKRKPSAVLKVSINGEVEVIRQ